MAFLTMKQTNAILANQHTLLKPYHKKKFRKRFRIAKTFPKPNI